MDDQCSEKGRGDSCQRVVTQVYDGGDRVENNPLDLLDVVVRYVQVVQFWKHEKTVLCQSLINCNNNNNSNNNNNNNNNNIIPLYCFYSNPNELISLNRRKHCRKRH